MANIILPAVPVLSEIDDSTKLLIEQAGEINRYPISDLDIGGGDVTIDLSGSSDTNGGNSINADTLGGKPASDYVLKDELILDSIGGSSLDDIKTYVNNQITNRVIHSGGKNLLKNTAKSLTKTGITFTINTDGSVTLNGTATNDCYFTITSGVLLPSGNYILSGCPAGGSMDSYIFYAAPAEGSNSIDIGNSVAFSADGTQKYSFTIRVTSGVTVTGLTFYPMIRLASETDDTYEPYYEGLKKLTDGDIELLWENASPASKFETKTLDVDLNDYQYFMVEYYAANNEKKIYSACGKVGGYCHFKYSAISATSVVEATRIVSSTSSTVTFNTCWKWQNTSGGFTFVENDFLLIPVKIYGIKGVY